MKIEELIEEARTLNAEDFQDLVLHLAKAAEETWEASGDNSWFDATFHLKSAAEAIARRAGE